MRGNKTDDKKTVAKRMNEADYGPNQDAQWQNEIHAFLETAIEYDGRIMT